jgi:hypothetical protein
MRVALVLALLTTTARADAPDVLVMGNSYVQGGQLDLVLADVLPLVRPGGGQPEVERRAAGGLRFVDHVSRLNGADPQWVDALAPGVDRWELVVLQEQSQIPGFPEGHTEVAGSRGAAQVLDGFIAAHSAETVFLATWGRRDGDAHNAERFPDFHTMNALLLDGYLAYAEDATEDGRRGTLAPAGLAFAEVWAADEAAGREPTADGSDFHALYEADGSHPSVWGTYLTALTLSVSVSGWPATGSAAPAESLGGERGAVLQAAADAAVLGDPFAVPLRFAWDWWDMDPRDEVEISDPWMRPQVRLADDGGTLDRLSLGSGGDDAVLWIQEGGSLSAATLDLGGARLIIDGGAMVSPLVEGAGHVSIRGGSWSPGQGTLGSLELAEGGTLALSSAAGSAELDAVGAVVLAGEVVVDVTSGSDEDVLIEAASLELEGAQFTLPDGIAVGTKTIAGGRVALVAGVGESGPDAADPDADSDSAADAAGERGGCGCAGVAGGASALPALLGLLAVGRRRNGAR